MKLLVLVFFTTISFISVAQPSKFTKKNDQHLKSSVDSIERILNEQYKEYIHRVDSVSSAQYTKQLERSVLQSSAKDSYYGTVFSGIAVIVTILVVFIGYNVLASSRESSRRLRELSVQSQTALRNQSSAYEEAFKTQTKKFNELEVKAKEFQEANQKNIDNYLNLLNEKIGSLQTTGNQAEKSIIEEIKQDIQRMKEANRVKNKGGKAEVEFMSVDITGKPFLIDCLKCGSSIAFDPPSKLFTVLSNHPTLGSIDNKKIPMIKCPNCGEYNDLPLQYTI